jgi:ABC-type uncharacterized transport system substrate-binding protein
MYGFREFVDAGGLIAYGVNVPYLCRRAAVYVDKIIKGSTGTNAAQRDQRATRPTSNETNEHCRSFTRTFTHVNI